MKRTNTLKLIKKFTQHQLDNYNSSCEIIDSFCIYILGEPLRDEMKNTSARIIGGEKLDFKTEMVQWCDNNSWGYSKAKFKKFPNYIQKRYIENIKKSIDMIYDDISLYW